jgi:DNA-binding MurR/RpiR family transcriptional regulator
LQEVDDVARAILDARKVWIVGFRAGHPFADYLRWQLLQVVEDVVSLPGAGETLGEQLVSVQKGDCVILFGLRRRVAVTERVLSHVSGTGAALVYVTDEGVEPESIARWHFRCHTMAPGPLFNHVSVMALCHLLVVRSIELAGGKARNRLRSIEMLNDGFDEL